MSNPRRAFKPVSAPHTAAVIEFNNKGKRPYCPFVNPKRHLGAFSDDILVGTASLVYSHCVTGTRVHIEDVVVDSEQRGKGIGTYLINETIDRAKKLQAKSIDLTSRPDREAANRLYRKLGFVQRETNVYRYASP
ncbi:unnamed protein product [Rhizopus microsporus]